MRISFAILILLLLNSASSLASVDSSAPALIYKHIPFSTERESISNTQHSFRAVIHYDKALLTWTSSKIEDTYYVIERSVDGVHYAQVGEMNERNKYDEFRFVDETPVNGINYYRISIAAVGTLFYHYLPGVINYRNNEKLSLATMSPDNGILKMIINSNSNVELKVSIRSVDGKEISTEEFSVINGSNVKIFKLPAGKYATTLTTSRGEVITNKFSVL
jgi:hypothetical protein